MRWRIDVKKMSSHDPVSIVIPMRNASTTILRTLKSVFSQKYPIQEVIIVDNSSTDESVKKVGVFKLANKNIPIRLIRESINRGVGTSYNTGISYATSDFVVFMHSDSILPSQHEVDKLVEPMRQEKDVVATYSYITLPLKIWETYPFWEKCLLATSVGKEKAGLNGKFDCVRKSAFIGIGGFNNRQYGHDMFIGGEDGDLHVRLAQLGRVICSRARVTHLHSLDPHYRFSDWISNRKLLARSYGRFVRMQWRHLTPGAILFAVKPTLALVIFILPFSMTVLLLSLFVFITMPIMYTNIISRKDPKIILLPFICVFLIYYESFWMIESFLFLRSK